MGQEYFINSESLQNKVRQLLPSQGGMGQGQDLSATTQIVPIIDLTETAEGSDVRPDLQTALSLDSTTVFNVVNTTSDVITNTGYFRIFGTATTVGSGLGQIQITDGATTKILSKFIGATGFNSNQQFDYIIFVKAGDTVQVSSSSSVVEMTGVTRQVASIDGTLVDP